MVAAVAHVTVALEGTPSKQVDAATASLRSIGDVLLSAGGPSKALAELFPDLFRTGLGESLIEHPLDVGELLVVDVIDGAAGRADKISLSVQPSDRYRELVAAVASDLNGRSDIVFSHGWPILSVGDRTPTVAEVPEATNLRDGGAA
jgi:hypothetical protein